MKFKTLLAVAALVVGPLCVGVACFDKLTIDQNQDQNHNNTTPSPSPLPAPSASPASGFGDNAVDSIAIFCYGFNTPPGQPEPNHGACALPSTFAGPIAVTVSPKNKAGIDIPNPTTNVVWSASTTGGVHFTVGENPFNGEVAAGTPRVAGTAQLTAVYTDANGKAWTATKLAIVN